MINLKKLESKIHTNKEILNTLPQNNVKNIKAYIGEITKFKEEAIEIQKQLEEEMKKRYDQISDIYEDPKINSITQNIESNEAVLYLLNEIDTSYEKMDLDKYLFNLKYYYRKNLEVVNDAIFSCIKGFEAVGIKLEAKDFDYSEYANEYITVFFREMENETINSKNTNKFDEIYWKCPEIIHHIFLNINYLYYQNKKQIDKYFEKKKESLLKKFTAQELIERYIELKIQLDEKKNSDRAIIVNKFLNGELNPKDYTEDAILDCYSKFVPKEDVDFSNEDAVDQLDANLEKLLNSLYEYKKYLEFKFIIDDIKKIYKEKDKYKNAYANIQKEIEKKEKERIKLNKNINKKSLFNKSKEKYIDERNALVLEIKKLYDKLYENKVYDKIITEINDNSTLKDALNLAGSFYKYLFRCICDMDKDIEEEVVMDIIAQIRTFLKYPYFTIMNNVKISEEKDIMIIIKDRYQLQDINIEKEDLELDNLDSMIELIQKIMIAHNIRKNKIDLEEIACGCDFKRLLNK